MKKKVVILNDELGTIALGFSKAGYDISALYIDTESSNSVKICTVNWGDIVRNINIDDFEKEDTSVFTDIDFIAGKIYFSNFNAIRGTNRSFLEDRNVMYSIRLLQEKRPSFFLFQCNRINDKNLLYRKFYDSVIDMGYMIGYEYLETRLITGFPVNERVCFIYGSLGGNKIKLDFLKNLDTLNYTFDYFIEKQPIDDKWYYNITPHYMQNNEKSNNAVLCWNRNHYEKTELVTWNPRMIPLVAYGDSPRKMTHREIARLKGIPDEYYFPVNNKAWLYQKLMYCSNVQLIQQIASAISIDIGDKYFQRRSVSKGQEFEKIMISYFDKKGVKNAKLTKNNNADFEIQTDEGLYFLDFKIYINNYGIEEKLVAACERNYEYENLDKKNYILIIGNIVSAKLKKKIEDNFDIYIWDVENLLWIFDEFPQIKSDFISLLSFSVSDIMPKKPEPYILERYSQPLYKMDLQEKLRKIQPGKEDAYAYEKLCEEIMRYLFSESLEFFDAQRKSNDGLYCFDYCGKIKHGNSTEFFDTIQNFFDTKYIVFEFKNYADEITQKEIYTTEKYLYEKALRKVAVIVSRKGPDENANKAARGSLREAGKLIICLSDENINKLIDIKNNSGDPGDFLEALLDDMLMDLEK